MRVLHVISGLDPENGGPTIALIGMAAAQVRAGLDVSVLATWKRDSGFPSARRMRDAGVHVDLVGPATGKLSSHPKLAGIVRSAVGRADVVHVHALWEQIQHDAMRAAADAHTPYVVTPHGMLSAWSFEKNRVAKLVYFSARVMPGLRRAAAIHFTALEEQRLAGRFNLRRPAIIEPCGIDLTEFTNPPPDGAFRARYPQLRDRPVVLFLGRLAPQKGLPRLIAALADPQANDGDLRHARFVIAGPDENGYRHQLEIDAQARHVTDRLLFTGPLSGVDRIAALREATLLVLPSLHENFGIVIAEALAAGTPVLISDGVNIWREIETAGVGAVFGSSPTDLARHLRQWLTDDALRATAAARAGDFARSAYDWQPIARRWAGHYQSLIRR